MPRLKCPRCATIIEAVPGTTPVCPNCGFGSASAPAAPRPLAPPAAAPAWQGQGSARMAAAPVASASRGQMADEKGPPVPGRLRPVPVGKTVGLGIITLGIYFLMRDFKISGDLHRMPGGWPSWQLFFWLRFIPYVGAVFTLILYFKNNKQGNLLAGPRGLTPSYTPFVLACIPIVNIVAPFVWASQYNALAART